jgi:hypothetical protein
MIHSIFVVLLCFITLSLTEKVFVAPHYNVDLDLPAIQRWSFLSAKYRPNAKAAQKYFSKYLSG